MTTRTHLRLAALLLLAGSACIADPGIGSETGEMAGGTPVPVGQFEAVGTLSLFSAACSATLVSDRVALTAAHCVCGTRCEDRAMLVLRDVRSVDDPRVRTFGYLPGDVIVHPDLGIGSPPNAPPGAPGTNDLAAIALDQPASETVLVSPITIAGALPDINDFVTMVGFGPTDGPGGECADETSIKRQATTQVDQIITGPAGDRVIRTVDEAIHGCNKDSGGALIDEQGHLAGVTSSSDLQSSTNFRAAPAYAEWIALQGVAPGGRVGVWDLSGSAPAAPLYADNKPDPLGLLGWIDEDDLRLTGDFLARGHDQVLYVNTGGGGGFVRLADYQDGVGPTDTPFWIDYGQPMQFGPFVQPDDVKLVGDFLARGYDQLLLINNSGWGVRVMIVDFAVGPAIPEFIPFEGWGQSNLLNGWHDPEDGFLVGDFFGDGYDSVLFVNRGLGPGRILIADFQDGASPTFWRYHETYSQGPHLDGWHDAEDLMFAGDFRGLARDQVLFINRGPGNRVLIVDFGDAAFPAEWQLLLNPTQATALSGFIDSEDRAFSGVFRGTGHQLALVNRSSAGLDRVRIADFSGSSITIPFNETYLATSGLVHRAIHTTDRVLAGDVTGVGRDQLVTLEFLQQ